MMTRPTQKAQSAGMKISSQNPVGSKKSDRGKGKVNRCSPWRKKIIMSTYNVRTLLKTGKLHELCTGAAKENVDIICIQEHRWRCNMDWDEVSVEDGKWKFIYTSADNEGNGGVGILVKAILVKYLIAVIKKSDRILTLVFNLNPQLTVITAYAPTEASEDSLKQNFYADLTDQLQEVQQHNFIFVGGDFNAQIGHDQKSSTKNVGRYTYHDKTNQNGHLLLDFCNACNLVISLTKFPHRVGRVWTWEHPNGTKNQIDHILIGGKWWRSVKNCRAYNTVEIMSDHRIVSAEVHLSLQSTPFNLHKQKWYDWAMLEDEERAHTFNQMIKDGLERNWTAENSVDGKYAAFENSVKIASEQTLQIHQKKKSQHWVSLATEEIIAKRNKARNQFRTNKSVENKIQLDTLNLEVDNALKEDKEKYINDLCSELETLQCIGDIRGTYKKINQLTCYKKAIRPIRSNSSNPGNSKDFLDTWRIYFDTLLNNENNNTQQFSMLNTYTELPINQEDFTLMELQIALQSMKNKKTPGIDKIPVEVYKYASQDVLKYILEICNRVLQGEELPKQWCEGLIIPIPKKGNHTKPEHYRGITLLSSSLKLFNKMLLNRIEPHITPILRPNQAGFLKHRSTIEQIHCVRRLLEGAMDKHIPMVLTFIDFTKAFDSIDRKQMFRILISYGIPQKIVKAIDNIYKETKARVLVNGMETTPFTISSGVLQGDVLSPYLFNICLDWIFNMVSGDFGITTDNIPQGTLITDLAFADDVVLFDNSLEAAQKHIDELIHIAQLVGLRINVNKTKTMMIDIDGSLQCEGLSIENVDNFQYLGSYIKDTHTDIVKRKQKALVFHNKLIKIWKSDLISLPTKLRLYKTTSRAIFLYGSQTWNITTKRSAEIINSFETTCLRIMLGYSWRDHITNQQVLLVRSGLLNENSSEATTSLAWTPASTQYISLFHPCCTLQAFHW